MWVLACTEKKLFEPHTHGKELKNLKKFKTIKII